MSFERASGILLHPTSLPGDFGIGDFGSEAFKFVDFLREAGQAYWQILPLGPTGYGDSPYQCFSAFAGNTLLLSPEKLVEDNLLDNAAVSEHPDFPAHRVDFSSVPKWKNEILAQAYKGFHRITSVDIRGKFEKFCLQNAWWLDDYALYRVIKADQQQKPWYEWPDELRLRDAKAIVKAGEELFEQIQAEKFSQFLFFRQWFELKRYANKKGIKVIGDIPIFIALDSADVWCNQNKFKLNADGTAKVIAGVPPDYFSKTGQLWGNPICDWDAMREDNFSWWTTRVHFTLTTVDIVRVDHFRGFCAAWEVPGKDKTAENGRWVDVPGRELFVGLKQSLGQLPMIAEDLGVITPDVEELRDAFDLPGMRILQFAFGGDANNHDLPHNYIKNCVAYTGTHDNDTTAGWWRSHADNTSASDENRNNRVREHCLKYLDSDGKEIHWDFVHAVWASVADTAMAPMQDILGIGTTGRMNLPATTADNWQWRLMADSIKDEYTNRLRELTETYGRIVKV
ncbi:MAG: 4-alpha-glucanotransferase [Pyrinomonadaceae bacterium]